MSSNLIVKIVSSNLIKIRKGEQILSTPLVENPTFPPPSIVDYDPKSKNSMQNFEI